jgi:hypothetical protein
MDRARYNLFTQMYPANLVNLVHVAFANYVHNQLMSMPDHLVTVPFFCHQIPRTCEESQSRLAKTIANSDGPSDHARDGHH